MDFIDKAIEKQRLKHGAAKSEQKPEIEEAEKREREIREQVDQFISKTVLHIVIDAKKRFEKNEFKAEIDIETSTSFDTEKSYCKGVKLQLKKSLDRKAAVPVVKGPTLYFSSPAPYSTAIAIVAYGADNDPVFSERFELTEMTEKLVVDFIKMFVDEVIK